MQPAHAKAMYLSLRKNGMPALFAERLVQRYDDLSKKRRAKLKPINRDRGTIKKARAALAKEIKALFDVERPKLAAQISDLVRRATKAEDDQLELIMGELDFDGWVTLTIDGEKILVHIVVDGSGQATTQIGAKLTPAMLDQVNEAAIEWAKERSAELVGMKYAADGTLVTNPNAEMAITDSTRDLLRADVKAAIDEGLSTQELADRLSESYAFSDDRAEMIARTEVAAADVQGAIIAYQESGVVEGKEWILGSEHDGEDECDEAAALGVVALDDDFGGIGDPPAHPNCTCDVLPVLIEAGETDT